MCRTYEFRQSDIPRCDRSYVSTDCVGTFFERDSECVLCVVVEVQGRCVFFAGGGLTVYIPVILVGFDPERMRWGGASKEYIEAVFAGRASLVDDPESEELDVADILVDFRHLTNFLMLPGSAERIGLN